MRSRSYLLAPALRSGCGNGQARSPQAQEGVGADAHVALSR